MRVLLDLEGEPGAVLRLVRALLKRLGRDHGVRCTSAREIDQAPAADSSRAP